MASNEFNNQESFWFPETLKEPTPEALTAKEMSQFLRRKAARHAVDDTQSATLARVYWHKGGEADFLERVPNLPVSASFTARLSGHGYEHPQLTGQALFVWTLTGEAMPTNGSQFRVFDLKETKWIGEGHIDEDNDGVFAYLMKGGWSDFCKLVDDCSRMVLVFFDIRQA